MVKPSPNNGTCNELWYKIQTVTRFYSCLKVIQQFKVALSQQKHFFIFFALHFVSLTLDSILYCIMHYYTCLQQTTSLFKQKVKKACAFKCNIQCVILETISQSQLLCKINKLSIDLRANNIPILNILSKAHNSKLVSNIWTLIQTWMYNSQ